GKKDDDDDDDNNNNRDGDVNAIQNTIKPNIIVFQENLDKVDRLQRRNEKQLAARDNNRFNHFKAQFSQAVSFHGFLLEDVLAPLKYGEVDYAGEGSKYTIIVIVTGLVDDKNQRQQAEPAALVMVTDPTPMQISTLNAASSQTDAFGAAPPKLSATTTTTTTHSFSQQTPLGQIGHSIIIPAGTQAPRLAAVPDPAAIILPGHQGLLVQNAGAFLADCPMSAAGGNAALAEQIFSSFKQLAGAQLAGFSGLGILPRNRGNSTAQAPPSPAAQGQQLGGQNLGSIAVGANQGQPAAVQPPAQVATPPHPIVLLAQVQTDGGQSLGAIVVGANQGQPPATAQPRAHVAAPASRDDPAPQPLAAVIDGANQAVGPVQIGKDPGTAPPSGNNGAAQPQSAPAPVPPAAVAASENQTKSTT
ncbi:hypothetical protein CTA2_10477, partial [Colletotrichum tanaceti]